MTEFRLPRYQDRDQPLDATALTELPRTIEDREEREIARQVLIDAKLDGAQTIGDVVSRFERASPPERREMVDRARESVGLPTLDDIEATERFEAIQPGRSTLIERQGCAGTRLPCLQRAWVQELSGRSRHRRLAAARVHAVLVPGALA